MALKAMNDNNINVLAKEDANHYYALSGYVKHYISKEYGQKFNVTVSGLVASLASGQGSIYGRHIINDGTSSITCTLPTNSSGYLVLNFDLTKTLGNELSFVTKTILETNDMANGGLKYDLPLYSYTTNLSSVTKFTDIRVYQTGILTTDKLADGAVTQIKIGGNVPFFSIIETWGE